MFSQWRLSQPGSPLTLATNDQQGCLTDVPPECISAAHNTSTSVPSDNLKQRLENISYLILDDHGNTRSFGTHDTLQYMAPYFRGKHDALPNTISRVQHMESLRARNKIVPNMRVYIKNIPTDLQDHKGVADVFIFYQIGGLAHEIVREAVAVIRWQRTGKEWMCCRVTTLRGSSGFAMV